MTGTILCLYLIKYSAVKRPRHICSVFDYPLIFNGFPPKLEGILDVSSLVFFKNGGIEQKGESTHGHGQQWDVCSGEGVV